MVVVWCYCLEFRAVELCCGRWHSGECGFGADAFCIVRELFSLPEVELVSVTGGLGGDSHVLVGSCAQIGKNVHLSGGVGIGGVLEPLQAAPVIIEDDCFVGSRCIVVEGVHVEKEAVLGANVVLTASTKIIDVTGDTPVELKGRVPARSVVIPGSYTKQFPAGEFQVPCALIIGKRKESTDKKTSLNDALRENNVAV